MDYEYIAKGQLFTKGSIKVFYARFLLYDSLELSCSKYNLAREIFQNFTGALQILISNITKTEKTGNYEPNVLKPLSDSLLVEMSCALPETVGYQHTAKVMRDVADQLLP